MAKNIIHAYLGGLTAKRGDDGFLRVKGLATDATLDLDEQICDPAWLKSAMPAWMEIGNIREMHQSKAVGKAMEMEATGTGFAVEAKVVDKDAALKVEEGIYTGFSIGIKGARVVKDAQAPGGRIVGGTIVEVSLVDRPANPSATIEIAKSVDGELVPTDIVKEIDTEATMTEEAGAPEVLYERNRQCAACSGTGKKDNVPEGADDTCDVCNGSGEEPADRAENIEHTDAGLPVDTDNNDLKDAEPEVEKRDYSTGERSQMAESGQAMPHGGFPIKTVTDLKNAIQAIGRAKNRAATIAHIKDRASALGRTDLIPEEWKAVEADLEKMEHNPGDLVAVRAGLIELIKAELDEMLAGEENEICDVQDLLCALQLFLNWWDKEADEEETVEPFSKEEEESEDTMAYIGLGVSADLIKSASASDATEELRDTLRSEIVKALGLNETITKAELASAREDIEVLKAELVQVKEMAAPGGPVLRATSEQNNKSARVTALQVEAERRRYQASLVSDPALRNSYLDAARKLEAEAQSL